MDPAFNITHRVLSDYAVCGFFILSGFLIRQSLSRSISLGAFFKKRALRIFPGLWVAILFSVFIIGTTTSTLPILKYLGNKETWNYLFGNSFLIPIQKTLPGLFDSNAETAVNGSLWTLRYELLFYVLLSLLFFIPKKAKVFSFIALLFCLIVNSLIKNEIFIPHHAVISFIAFSTTLGAYFAAGATLSFFTDIIKQNKTVILILSAFLFFLSVLLFKERFETINILTFSLMVLSFGLHYFGFLNFSQYTGDISYGTYIYAFPIQQALIVWLHPSSIWHLLLPSLLLSWLAGLLSWHFVEKQFLRRR